MKECVITSAVRTAVGGYLGSLKTVEEMEYTATVIKEAISRSNIKPEDVDHVVMGTVLSTGNIARAGALLAGLPEQTPAYSVDRLCGSSLQAVVNASQEIYSGASDIVVAGGVESMSRMFYIMPRTARYQALRLGDVKLKEIFNYIVSEQAQPVSMYPNLNMGLTAENLAEKYGITRDEQDAFALDSQMKTKAATESGKFKDEIVPFEVKERKKSFIFDIDEHPKPDANLESLAKLPAVFKKDGSVSAGNSSGMNDGASAVVVMSAEKAKELNCKPMVKILASTIVGVDPKIMGIGPAFAIPKVLKMAGLTMDQIGLFEINEAFAAQSLAVLKEMKMDMGTEGYKKVNVNGGAIAHGHALGNSGTRILTTLIYEMKRRDVKYGVASLCIGGGQGIAMVVENC